MISWAPPLPRLDLPAHSSNIDGFGRGEPLLEFQGGAEALLHPDVDEVVLPVGITSRLDPATAASPREPPVDLGW